MSSDHQSTYDVIIAGAGQVVLYLSCELALGGCSVLVLERAVDPQSPLKMLPFGLRGLTLPTMDSLDRRDLLEPIKERIHANRGAAAAPWTAGARRPAGHFAGLQFFRDLIDASAWPWRPAGGSEMLAAALTDIEAVLAARAAALGVVVRYGCGVDALEQLPDGVIVEASGERLRSDWLVGCDGGRSTVRKAAGIGFAGTEPEFTGYSMALRLAEPNPLRSGRQHTGEGMYTYAPPGTVTMVEFDGGACHRVAALSREHVETVLRRVSGTEVTVRELDLATTWTDRAFLATEYSKGRVLLAGDAAHVHAPLGGQGLNLGLGDAMNLGWKLAATIAGSAPPALLDSYEKERRPVAQQVLDWSRAQVALLRPDPGSAALRSIIRDLMETRDGATYFAGRVWGAGLRYEDDEAAHPLIGRNAPDVSVANGQRLNEIMRDGRSQLLDLDPAAPLRLLAEEAGGRLGYLLGDKTVDLACDALLIRPDGVVAWAGSTADCVSLALAISRLIGDGPR